MSASAAPAPPAEKKVPTTTTVATPVGSASATAALPEWLSGTYMTFYMILFVIWLAAYYFGAAKMSYDQTGSGLYAFVAFLFAPVYYPYYAFVISKPASMPMMGGGRDPIVNLYKAAKDVYKTFKPKA